MRKTLIGVVDPRPRRRSWGTPWVIVRVGGWMGYPLNSRTAARETRVSAPEEFFRSGGFRIVRSRR